MDLHRMHTLGNLELLDLRKVAFLCSRSCPSPLRERALAWAAGRRHDDSCVVSGFQSPIEQEVLLHLLPGSAPLVVVLARGLKRELEPELKGALERGRLLLLTRYAESVTHPCEESCYQRNRLMMELAEEAVVGYAAPGGKLEQLCREFSGKKEILYLAAGLGDAEKGEKPPAAGSAPFR